LTLDWRPLYNAIRVFVLPQDYGPSYHANAKRNVRTYTKMCTFAQIYFDPKQIPEMVEEFLPYFSMSNTETAFVVTGLLNLFLPTSAAPEGYSDLLPQSLFPTFFHLWSLVNRSRIVDVHFLDLFSRTARDMLQSPHVPFSPFGIYTKEQSEFIFTAVLRVLELPVGQSSSAYSHTVDTGVGTAAYLDRDSRKHPVAHQIARWIVMSLTPSCAEPGPCVMSYLEDLINGIETFFHPSNSGHWTKTLSQLVYYLSDFFVMRWNRERSGEMDVPESRKLNDAVKARFVRCLREVVFMGIFAKSGTAMNFSLSALQYLAYLEPNLILGGALQRIYPALQGNVEVHRTISAIRALQVLTKTMAKTYGYRCHIMSLLGFALPGIDPNDLEKTIHTLAFIQSVAYNVPLHNMGKAPEEEDEEGLGNHWAVAFITQELEFLEKKGPNVELNYEKQLKPDDELKYLASSTANLHEFVDALLERVFTLLKNLPDASRVRSGSPEENVVNTLPATFTPFLASLSAELYDVALNKIADFVIENVVNQARDAVAFLCNALVKINPEKALQRLLPGIIAGITTEIDENGAGSTRTIGSDVLPRDQALVWHISMLSMCVVHVGDAVMKFKEELSDIARFMQKKCKGIPTTHISNFIHHILLNLTSTYTVDFFIFEPEVLGRRVTADDWGKYTKPDDLTVKWHVPTKAEIQFAIELFQEQATGALESLEELVGPNSPIARDGTGKAWSDEVSRNLVLIRLIHSGISVLWDGTYRSITEQKGDHMDIDPTKLAPPHNRLEASNGESSTTDPSIISLSSVESINTSGNTSDDEEPNLGETEDELKPSFRYTTGYPLDRKSKSYIEIHELRENIGELLHDLHEFLIENQQDDVACFNALYNAYRSWFVDVGIERSAHILDRVSRLLRADTSSYKFSGLRKDYPRPLLVRRANLYHLQRLRHNAQARSMHELEKKLLLDLAQSSVSTYTEIRRTAQGACEYAVKTVTGARLLIIPPLLDALEDAVQKHDFPRIKGGMFSLLFGSMAKTIHRNWRYAPRLVRAFIEITTVDKPSISKLATNATWSVMEMGRPLEQMVIFEKEKVQSLQKYIPDDQNKSIEEVITNKKRRIQARRDKVEKAKFGLSEELVEMARTSHWKKAARAAAMLVSLGMRFDRLASPALIDLITKGSTDTHPALRGLYQSSLVGLFSLMEARVACQHDYERFLLMDEFWYDKITVDVRAKGNPNWTRKYLDGFAQPNTTHYVDQDWYGWLVWNKTISAYEAHPGDPPEDKFDSTERKVRSQIGGHLDRDWFKQVFDYLKQEPRDSAADRFRMSNCIMLFSLFDLVFDDSAEATFEDIKDLVKEVWGDGSDKHQHRATAEILGGLMLLIYDSKPKLRNQIVEYVFGITLGVFKDGLTPETASYWASFIHWIMSNKDPRRVWPFLDWLASFRLDMDSNAAFKESSKITLLNVAIAESGWHFQLYPGILEDFLEHLDHPYKGVREAMGMTLAKIYRSQYYEAYSDIPSLMKAQREASSIGIRPYQPTEKFRETIKDVFERLEKWRQEYKPGETTPSAYQSASKTVLIWLDSTLSSHECTQLVEFFAEPFTEQLLHMMDKKEDPDLQALAFHVFKQLPNIPARNGEDTAFIDALMRIGRTATSWHQRLRTLINIQVIFFNRLFLMSRAQQLALFDCVSSMLEDPQLEVRHGAQSTLSGMIKCAPLEFRDDKIHALKDHFTEVLERNPLPKRNYAERSSTPTVEQNRIATRRHAAVLGLGALISAFPYTSPPPEWVPQILAFLALKAAGDPGVTGKSAKQILADFKKARQDTWHVDIKVCSFPSIMFMLNLTNISRSSMRDNWRIWKAYCGRATLLKPYVLLVAHDEIRLGLEKESVNWGCIGWVVYVLVHYEFGSWSYGMSITTFMFGMKL
jgi:proteasome activator subunit 4